MKIRIAVLLIAGLLSTTLLSAQNVGKRVENRAKYRAESKVNREVDKTVDKAMDNVFDGLFGKKKKKKKEAKETEAETVPAEASGHEDNEAYNDAEAQRQAQETINRMLGGEQEEWEPVKNDAPISFNMEITSEEKNKTTTSKVKYTFDTWLLGMQMEQDGEEMLLLLDNENGTMTTVMEKDGKRQGYQMSRRMFGMPDMDEVTEGTKITPTGNTKMIDGYFCREYLVESKEGTTHAWMTKEIQADMYQLYGGFVGAAKGQKKKNNNTMMLYKDYGVMLEATTEQKNGEKVHTKISNIKLGDKIDRSILDISDVEVTNMGY